MQLDKDAAEGESRVTARFADIVGNIPIVKLFGAKDREKAGYEDVSKEHYGLRMKAWTYASIQSGIIGMSTTGMYASTLIICYTLWKHGHFTPGDFVLMVTYSAMLSETLWISNRSLRRFSQAVADASEMVAIMQEPVEIADILSSESQPSIPIGSITFDNVCFAYPNGTTIFDQLSLSIATHQKVAIIGPTGSGKTTLVNLLLRNIEAQRGTITLEPYNIVKDLTQDGLKSLISTVSQNADLFHRTIRENIAYGRPDATDQEIHAAAKKARIHDFILRQPDGYETLVGERGVHLSGGQKQRIAIARALLHDAPILIFDEATSSLDNVTEKEIQSILEEELRDKTVIIIAHRLSTVRNCDRILVLENGTLIQDGTHEELILQKDGMYNHMLNSHALAVRPEVYS
jgi:ATP-binding cassette subfamily B protein